ncbi:SAM hydrolase/SAM-dependent halogenase family protein [Haloarcula rubripromontorii]|uniref:S-adenosyl-l-methionine hydroxide adenosyltransferase n=1 Tax=Haloarcula rubripromontorii TaxID=1705562 RepID=A0A0N0BPF9_9EURY|nr:SAM-dependent chlorinase/fluorinase [Haloarcula rubripromontorii]KOX93723.1 S-adenosyl-l-methionine hydroxide adenosyltransferase [Haloarcula rubripromontorii]NLV05622.1 S-adenosyl-l-methionine hydroxide adenosyltransferase [Haloarcula rubripromontorii]
MITLSSDFGSPYPAAMKGVICRATDARIEDIAHDFPRQDVRAAAFWLTQTLPYFPPAVHCVVVDPGVGTDRDALVVRAGEHALVGPDNGVLLPVARELAANETDTADAFEVFTWAYDDPASTTFHGRDVFAPAAAAVHDTGVDNLEARTETTPTDDYVDLRFPAASVDGDDATGEVLVVDDFGNAVTNIPGEVLADRFGGTIEVDGRDAPVCRAYAAVDRGQRLVTVGSHGNVELAVNRGRGDEAFGVSAGDTVALSL